MSETMNGPRDPSVEPTKLEHEAYGWVARFVSGAASADDITALKQWSAQSSDHAAAFDQASKVWRACAPIGRVSSVAGVARVRAAGGGTTLGQARLGRRALLGGALAASAAGAAIMVAHPTLGLWPSWSELAADFRTDTGEQRRITLADDISIDMNTRTSIALRSGGGEPGRIELIGGEAMVSTPPKSSGAFTVIAADGRIVATDARFNVRCDDRQVCVTCLRGEVRVECGTTGLPLSAGRQVAYADRGIGPVLIAQLAIVTAWQDGIVIFDATPIVEVVREVNRYRPGKIIVTNAALGHERFSARFRIANIDRVVGQIEQVFGARATTLPGGIVLLG